MNRLAAAGAALLGGQLKASRPLSGGELSEILLITLQDGRQAVAKNGPSPPMEADMLRAMAAAGAPVPRVLAADRHVLVIEWRPDDGDLHASWKSLGEALARLHAASGTRYGWGGDYAFGRLRIDNAWHDDWPGFWAERRLLPHLPHLPAALAQRIEGLAADLPNRLPARPPAALLHGDLWSGNVLACEGRISALIDPACYYGHGEVDLAMLQLFASPGPGFFEAYGPLEPGHAQRLPIYSLWPALVHLRLFGPGYRGTVERFLVACGA